MVMSSTNSLQHALDEVAVGKADLKSIVGIDKVGALPGQVIGHLQGVGAPDSAWIFPIVLQQEGFQKLALAVEEIDPANLKNVLIGGTLGLVRLSPSPRIFVISSVHLTSVGA